MTLSSFTTSSSAIHSSEFSGEWRSSARRFSIALTAAVILQRNSCGLDSSAAARSCCCQEGKRKSLNKLTSGTTWLGVHLLPCKKIVSGVISASMVANKRTMRHSPFVDPAKKLGIITICRSILAARKLASASRKTHQPKSEQSRRAEEHPPSCLCRSLEHPRADFLKEAETVARIQGVGPF
jgi:hypothetical protein